MSSHPNRTPCTSHGKEGNWGDTCGRIDCYPYLRAVHTCGKGPLFPLVDILPLPSESLAFSSLGATEI